MPRAWMLLLFSLAVFAQDPFELYVFEYDPLPSGAFTNELHTNYVARGSTPHHAHISYELTAGITDEIRFGAVILNATTPGRGAEYAGIRILPHFYAPRSWNLPVNLGLVTELSLERPGFDEATRNLELRGIVGRHVGRLQLDGNLVFARDLRSTTPDRKWNFEPAARVGWQVSRSVTPSLEYYGDLGPVTSWLPARSQVHVFLPGADLKRNEGFTWSFGVGFGVAGAGERLVIKSRFEFASRRHRH